MPGEIEGEKEDPFDVHPAPSSALHAAVVIPMVAKDFSGFTSQTGSRRDANKHSSPAFCVSCFIIGRLAKRATSCSISAARGEAAHRRLIGGDYVPLSWPP